MKSDTKLTKSETMINVENTFNPFQIYRNAAVVTPSDDDELSTVGVLYASVGGDVKVDLFGSGTITYTLESGEWLPVLVEKVYATGTTATVVLHW